MHALGGPLFGDSIIAAILDRLLHHSTTINTRRESYPLMDRRRAGLVPPRGQDGTAASSLVSDGTEPSADFWCVLGGAESETKEARI
jgi:hypothetical protein